MIDGFMKKYLSTVLSLLCIIACQEHELVPESVSEGNDLYASVESVDATRTSMDQSNNVLWSEGDQLVAFMKTTLGIKYQIKEQYIGTSTGGFSKIEEDVNEDDLEAGQELEHNVVLYPHSTSAWCMKNDSESKSYKLNVDLPETQIYAKNSFGNGAFPMVAVSQDNKLTFKNICGGIKLQLKGEGKIASIKFEGLDDEVVCGQAEIVAYADGTAPIITMNSKASNSMVLDCGEGVQLNQESPITFILAIPPMEFRSGMKITITDTDGFSKTLTNTSTNTIRRSSLLVFPVITYSLEGGVISPSNNEYIDEYGISHGSGINIDGVIWAPVNCGYYADGFRYGKLYQWGRKYGQGYYGYIYDFNGNKTGNDSDIIVPAIERAGISKYEGESKEKANIFFLGNYNWIDVGDDKLWNEGSEDFPIKAEYDPCPAGWRVPTAKEMGVLVANKSSWTTNADGLAGCWFSGGTPYSTDVSRVFLPAAGYHHAFEKHSGSRNSCGDYWTSRAGEPEMYAYFYRFSDGHASVGGRNIRGAGASVRCVYDSNEGSNGSGSFSELLVGPDNLKLYIGNSTMLNIVPLSADIEWTSDNPAVASVNNEGQLTAHAAGKATITARMDNVSTTCHVIVSEIASYIDEYDINHGKGIKIGNVVWAPVNCGYHNIDYKWGKLYQWGRLYGQGYSGYLWNSDYNYSWISDAETPIFQEGVVSLSYGQSETNKNVFFIADYHWLDYSNDDLWNSQPDYAPRKTEYDPCPPGWRVPTAIEIEELITNHSIWTTNDQNQTGYWFSGPESYSSSVSQVFLPAAGIRYSDGSETRGNIGTYWSSKPYISAEDWAYNFEFNKGSIHKPGYAGRAYGCSIRCVQE